MFCDIISGSTRIRELVIVLSIIEYNRIMNHSIESSKRLNIGQTTVLIVTDVQDSRLDFFIKAGQLTSQRSQVSAANIEVA